MSETPTLFEWAGGRDAIARMIDCFYDRQPGADVIQRAPVPHWGWGVAPPHQA